MKEVEDESEDVVLKGPMVIIVMAIIPILCVIAFEVFFYRQEKTITNQLKECSFYTVATPTEMNTSTSMFYKFNYKDVEYEKYTTVGSGDLGLTYTIRSAMSTRYWVRVYCKDLNINRMYWDAKVPDTLQYIPKEGWKEIPYGLAEEE